MKKDLQFTSVKELAKHFKKLGFFVYTKSVKAIHIEVPVVNKGFNSISLDNAEMTFSAATPQEMYEQYITWIKDKSLWDEQDRAVIFNDDEYLDLADEILNLGFVSALVEHEDTNFVEVEVEYEIRESTFTTPIIREETFVSIGDKYDTLEAIKSFVSQKEDFKPTNMN